MELRKGRYPRVGTNLLKHLAPGSDATQRSAPKPHQRLPRYKQAVNEELLQLNC